jgi:hypothetical protein
MTMEHRKGRGCMDDAIGHTLGDATVIVVLAPIH